jgi:EAL domain-containing protein (putative c-di-GMP-specific phosphodiesterase class I)
VAATRPVHPGGRSIRQIVALGDWCCGRPATRGASLTRQGHALLLSINISPRQFREPDFVAEVQAIIGATGVPPQQLIFEVTEGLLVDDQDLTIARMGELAQCGIRFSIDDFVTG